MRRRVVSVQRCQKTITVDELRGKSEDLVDLNEKYLSAIEAREESEDALVSVILDSVKPALEVLCHHGNPCVLSRDDKIGCSYAVTTSGEFVAIGEDKSEMPLLVCPYSPGELSAVLHSKLEQHLGGGMSKLLESTPDFVARIGAVATLLGGIKW